MKLYRKNEKINVKEGKFYATSNRGTMEFNTLEEAKTTVKDNPSKANYTVPGVINENADFGSITIFQAMKVYKQEVIDKTQEYALVGVKRDKN